MLEKHGTLSYLRNSLFFMDLENSLPFSQQPYYPSMYVQASKVVPSYPVFPHIVLCYQSRSSY